KDLKMPEGIAVAFDGDLIVAEVGARRIVRIDPVKGTVTEIAGNLPIGLPAAPGGLPSNIPTGVGIGATGTIYFSSDIENAIYKVTRPPSPGLARRGPQLVIRSGSSRFDPADAEPAGRHSVSSAGAALIQSLLEAPMTRVTRDDVINAV